MSHRWNILYRGPLSSCNYACDYCPFAKTRNTGEELRDDAAKLTRFIDQVERREDREIGVLFTPWGEALVHRAYQQALLRLGRMNHVYRAAIQTNLACSLDWLEEADRDTVALWCTFHPTETTVGKFAAKIHRLRETGIRHSVGVVGLKEHQADIAALRSALPEDTYLWVNAYKRVADYYGAEDVEFLRSIDRLFPINNQRHPSRGLPCHSGHASFTVDGDGMARRCHFIASPLGSFYDADFDKFLAPSPVPCVNDTCGCHIGYVHLPHLGLDEVYGDGILERIPMG
ncbi:radical SAM protein [Luteolibacter yonseiensis]|uniref:Radical SAM protein n=1 Tax=Luteolibacter yonseiensis TaxID=1144680 RepID=A0A934QYI0_9BACT|nr:STM4011 family radical SAM protein [Luteolibacter yonseiensis]MBK1815043.1 radical SAM protein [Luteolibacter yonseiensis]